MVLAARSRGWRLFVLCCATIPCALAGHYGAPPCAADEQSGEVQGASGIACVPRCDAGTSACPVDAPAGTKAVPQCMLQDLEGEAFCGLLCTIDADCPSGRCQSMNEPQVGVCTSVVAFADLAKANTVKLAYSLPTNRPGTENARNYGIAKTVASLQNLEKRFGIRDDDADVLFLKEFMSTLAGSSQTAPVVKGADLPVDRRFEEPKAGLVPSSSPSGMSLSLGNLMPTMPKMGGLSDSDNVAVRAGREIQNDVSKDFRYLENTLEGGTKGLHGFATDTVWELEHLNQYGVSTNLLQSLIFVALLYLGIGGVIRFQTMGATGWDIVPHIGFWTDYPKLVTDGIMYAKILAGVDTSSISFESSRKSPSPDFVGSSPPRSGGGSGDFDPL